MAEKRQLIDVRLDERTLARRGPDIEHERKIAIHDLLEKNFFSPANHDGGPYAVRIGVDQNRLVLDIRTAADEAVTIIGLSLAPFRRIVKDYFEICENYFSAIKSASPSRIETLDMARRSLHNEGSELLQARLAGKIETDFDTARRLFTLLCALSLRG